jgi:hypothetical protein
MKKNAFSPFKTRQQIAAEYDISYPTFWRKMKSFSIKLPGGLLSPNFQKTIYDAFGYPKGVHPADFSESKIKPQN